MEGEYAVQIGENVKGREGGGGPGEGELTFLRVDEATGLATADKLLLLVFGVFRIQCDRVDRSINLMSGGLLRRE